MALIIYLDASVLVALHVPDHFRDRAIGFVEASQHTLLVSDFAAAEFSSAIARLARTGALPLDMAQTCFTGFDTWMERSANALVMDPADLRAATRIVRRLDLGLRTSDAIHLAIADRLGAALATFDRRLAIAATALGVKVADA